MINNDKNKISSVLVNLLSNAVKFTNKEGKIRVILEKPFFLKDEIIYAITVKDNGIGIPEDLKNKIFSLFSTQEMNKNSNI